MLLEVKKDWMFWQYDSHMKYLRHLFGLFLLSTLVSQSIMDGFSILLVLGWLGIFWSSRQTSEARPLIRRFGLEAVWGLWLLIVALGFVLHPMDLSFAAARLLEFKWILILYLLIEVFAFLKPAAKDYQYLPMLVILISAISLMIYFCDFNWLKNLRYGGETPGNLRVGGLFVNPMTFAHSFSMFVAVVTGYTLVSFSRMSGWSRGLFGIAFFLGGVTLLLTFTRGVWISFSLALILAGLMQRRRLGILMMVAVFLTLLLGYYFYEPVQMKLQQTLAELNGYSERKLLWQAHWQIFTEHPWLGVGYGQNTLMLPEYFKKLQYPESILVSHAHNQYIHLLAGMGILGLTSYLLTWAYFLLQMLKVWRSPLTEIADRGIALGLLMAGFSFLIGGMTEAKFEHSKVRYVVLLLWAYAIFLAKKYKVLGWRIGGSANKFSGF